MPQGKGTYGDQVGRPPKKSSGFKMTGSPHKTGVIEGTSGHASAFKQVDLSALRPDEPEELTDRDKYYDELNETKFQEIVDAAKAKEEKLGPGTV